MPLVPLDGGPKENLWLCASFVQNEWPEGAAAIGSWNRHLIMHTIFIIAALVVGGLVAYFLSRDAARNGFLLCIVALSLGYRNLRLTEALWIHPAEVALFLVLLIAVFRIPFVPKRTKGAPLPWWLWALLPFMVLAWLPRPHNPFPWDEQLAECSDGHRAQRRVQRQ